MLIFTNVYISFKIGYKWDFSNVVTLALKYIRFLLINMSFLINNLEHMSAYYNPRYVFAVSKTQSENNPKQCFTKIRF